MGRTWTGALALLAITAIVYAPAIQGGFFWDDESYVSDNATLIALDGLGQIWLQPSASPQYYPLVFTTFWLERRLWGLNPLGYHAVNVALHAANVLLLWVVLGKLQVAGAFAAAALFAVHPVHVESVAWITERKDLLSGTLCLLALLAWLRFAASGRGRTRWCSYAAALFLFAAAMLSKTAVCTFPLVVLLLSWWKEPEYCKRRVMALLPFFGVAAALSLVTVWREHAGSAPDILLAPLSLPDKVAVAGRALWFYAGRLVWPLHLMPVYPRWDVRAGSWVQYGWLLAAAVAVVLLWVLRRRIGKGAFVAVGCFALALAPMLGLVSFDFLRLSYVADHFQYLASAALIAGVVAGAVSAVSGRQREPRWLGLSAFALLLAVLGALAWRQASLWADAQDLWRYNVAENPSSWTAHSNLGTLLERGGDVAAAREQFESAVRVQPDAAQAQYNLATLLGKHGDQEKARRHFAEALRVKPDFALAHYGLGTLDLQDRLLDAAIGHFGAAVRAKPEYAEAHYNLGIALAGKGELDAAIEHFAAAVRAKPDYVEAQNNWGALLHRQGQLAEAIEHYRAALSIKPDHPNTLYNLGMALATQGRLDEAADALAAAVRVKPDYTEARRQLAAVQQARGERPPAAGGEPSANASQSGP